MRFWIVLMAVLFAAAIVGMIVLAVASAALATWGLLGAFLVFAAVAIGVGWWIDSRRPPRLDRV